jgi:hypothetical protein
LDVAFAHLEVRGQRDLFMDERCGGGRYSQTSLASDQAGIPAELKHINKRRKRNQPGLPQ